MNTSTARAYCLSGLYNFPPQAGRYLATTCSDPVTGLEGYGSAGRTSSGTKYIYVECLSGTCNQRQVAIVDATTANGQSVRVSTTATGGSASKTCSQCVQWGLYVGLNPY
jgi:hypothetical protein